VEFVTPDFEVKSAGKSSPYRVFAQAQMYDKTCNIMWSPSCVLEGTAKLNGKEQRLVLYDVSPGTADYAKFGSSRISLAATKPSKEAENTYPHMNRVSLSRVLRLDNKYYEVRFSEDKQQALLKPSTLPIGSLQLAIAGSADMKSSEPYLTLVGDKDKDVNFSVSTGKNKTELPALAYRIQHGNLSYWAGPGENPGQKQETRKNLWQCDFKDGSAFTVLPKQTASVEIGKPELSITAVDERKRNQTNVTTQTLFHKGDSVYLSRVVKGKAGEQYGRFRQGDDWNGNKPTYKITDAANAVVTSGTLEYG
jgi:hypothetical protein